MNSITITKKEYGELLEAKLRYQRLKQVVEEDILSPPPTRSIKDVLQAFSTTKRYNKRFLESLERGLKRSSYFKA